MSTEFESRVCEIAATFNTLNCVFALECNSFLCDGPTFSCPMLFTELCPNTHQHYA